MSSRTSSQIGMETGIETGMETGGRASGGSGVAGAAGAGRKLRRLAASSSVLTMIDQVIYSASNFLTTVIIARTSEAPEFGLYFLGLRLVDYLREVESVLIWSPYMFFSPQMRRKTDGGGAAPEPAPDSRAAAGEHGSEHACYTGSTLIHQLSFSSLGSLLFILAAITLPLFSQPASIVAVMWPLALMAAMVPLQEYTRRICFANLRIKTVIALDAAVTVLQLGGLAGLAWKGRMSTDQAYWLIGAANGVVALCWLILARREFVVTGDRVVADFRRNFAMGKWLLGGNLTLLANQQAYPWSLGLLHGTAATGFYAAGEGIINFIRAFLVSVQNYLGPRLAHAWARGGMPELRQSVRRTGLLLVLAVGGLCSIVAVFGGQLATLIYGARYSGLRLMIALLAANIFAHAVTTAHSYALSTMERPEINFKINLVGLAITVTAGLMLVRAFGPIGAGCGLLVSTLTGTLLRSVTFARLAGKAERSQ